MQVKEPRKPATEDAVCKKCLSKDSNVESQTVGSKVPKAATAACWKVGNGESIDVETRNGNGDR